MARTEQHGTKGTMWLKHSWSETSSGHVETLDDSILESTTDGKDVVLVKTKGVTNFIKTSEGSKTEERYQISADDLISLIKQHGRRV